MYSDLITSEHADKPKFVAAVDAVTLPLASTATLASSLPSKFDLDGAIGHQLDAVGLWVGISRFLETPLEGVYFSFDTELVGFDEGTWLGPYDDVTGLTELPDDSYRVLIRAKIANNQWLGNIPTAYIFLNQVFESNTAVIQDNGDMTMLLGVVGSVALNAVTTALLYKGYLDVKPVGVRIDGYVTQTVLGSPLFGFDADNATLSGFDEGGWALITGGL